MVIKAFATGNLDNGTLFRRFMVWPAEAVSVTSEMLSATWGSESLPKLLSAPATFCLSHLLPVGLSIHPSPQVPLLMPGPCCVAALENIEQKSWLPCSEWFPHGHPPCWKATGLKHGKMKREASTEFGEEVSQTCEVRDVKDEDWAKSSRRSKEKGGKVEGERAWMQHDSSIEVLFPAVEVIRVQEPLYYAVVQQNNCIKTENQQGAEVNISVRHLTGQYKHFYIC